MWGSFSTVALPALPFYLIHSIYRSTNERGCGFTCIVFHGCNEVEVGVNISFHLLDTPRGTVELQLLAQSKLGLEGQLRTKTMNLAIVHDAWTQRVESNTKRERNERLSHKERR